MAVLLTAAPSSNAASPVRVVGDPAGTEYVDAWSSSPGPATSSFVVGGCRGTFSALIQNSRSVQFGAVWQCQPKATASIRASIEGCQKFAANDYFCSNRTYGPVVTLNSNFIRSDAYFPCVPGAGGYYWRPKADAMVVNGIPVSEKTGIPVYANCS